jgi:hypothetical protein
MVKNLKFSKIVEDIISEINDAKRKSESIHSAGNIRSSGDEVENLIREKISLFLPDRYMVKQGHIINSEGKVSNQFDIIIFDRLNTPKFFESSNKTVFYPIESVLAVGEIKKTLRSKDPVDFGKKIKYLKEDMNRRLVVNTAYGNQVKSNTSLADIVNMPTNRRFKNSLFSFIFAIDADKIEDLEIDDDSKYIPTDIDVLNYGFFMLGEVVDERIISKIEDENPENTTLIEVKKPGVICLATLFYQLIEHLNKSYVEPFGISNYLMDPDYFMVAGSEIKAFKIK